jgi:large subunit ribosomal protein L19
MVTMRRVSFGVGVEITIPLHSPSVSKIDIVKRAKARKSKLYYLRKKDFRVSKLKMKELDQFVAKEEENIPAEEKAEEAEKKEKEEETSEKKSE